MTFKLPYEETAENQRVIETNGAKIFLNRKDPFGFWYIKFERGEMPDILTGAYTSAELAIADINKYLDNHKSREKKVT